MTPAERQELKALAEAERHIAEGERIVTEQRVRVEQMRARGDDTTLAEGLLASLRSAMDQHREHRRLIL